MGWGHPVWMAGGHLWGYLRLREQMVSWVSNLTNKEHGWWPPVAFVLDKQ